PSALLSPPLSLHDALPISRRRRRLPPSPVSAGSSPSPLSAGAPSARMSAADSSRALSEDGALPAPFPESASAAASAGERNSGENPGVAVERRRRLPASSAPTSPVTIAMSGSGVRSAISGGFSDSAFFAGVFLVAVFLADDFFAGASFAGAVAAGVA